MHTLSIDVAAIRGPYWFVMLSESLARTETNEGSSSLKRRGKKDKRGITNKNSQFKHIQYSFVCHH